VYETFSNTVREAVHDGRDLAMRRQDLRGLSGNVVEHTGHLLVGLLATGACRELPALSTLGERASELEAPLDTLPDDLITTRRHSRCSDTFALTIEHALKKAQHRKLPTISTEDLICGLVAAKPNAALYLLQQLGISDEQLMHDLR
jgi:ATP-dependent Clp protease ATP-binding subunit ClpA